MNPKELLFSVLRAGVCAEQGENTEYTEESLAALFPLAVKHDLAHIAGQVLGKRKGAEKFAQAAMGAILTCWCRRRIWSLPPLRWSRAVGAVAKNTATTFLSTVPPGCIWNCILP